MRSPKIDPKVVAHLNANRPAKETLGQTQATLSAHAAADNTPRRTLSDSVFWGVVRAAVFLAGIALIVRFLVLVTN